MFVSGGGEEGEWEGGWLTVDAELFALGYVMLFKVWRGELGRGSIERLYYGAAHGRYRAARRWSFGDTWAWSSHLSWVLVFLFHGIRGKEF